jgi:uncharacterized membrane protein HdeD (DUF308 family)
MIETLVRNWWMLALRGVAAVLFGLAAFIWPSITLTVLVLLFGAYAFVDGILALLAASRLHGDMGSERWWALLVEGLVGVAAGILTFIWPSITTLVLLYLIAAWAVVTGVFEILTAIRLRKEVANEWMLALAGVASVVFGVLLAIHPSTGAVAVVWLIGAYAIVFGLLLLALAFRLRGHKGAFQHRMINTI